MICEHAHCTDEATTKTRFGNGRIDRGGNKRGQRQTFVHYCDAHFQTVSTLFFLCDITLEDRPNGPLQVRLPRRHPDLVARTSP